MTAGCRVFTLCLGLVLVAACQSKSNLGSTIGFEDQGSQGDVSVIDPTSRGHLTTGLTTADYAAIAEKVTNDMLVSPTVVSWGNARPRIILGDVVNNTDNENIRVKDVYARIQQTLFTSGTLRVVDRTATDFEYIIKPEMTSTRQYGSDGQELAFFTMQLKLFKLDGELVGQWSDDLALARTS